jgi:hypothetical protein
MDPLYSKFKPRFSKSTIQVAGIQMAKQAAMRQKCATAKAPSNLDASIKLDLEISDKSSECKSEGDETSAHKKKGKRCLCNVSMGNRDLAKIDNGFPGNSLKSRSFDYTFTKKNIINSWITVGFLPMTANAVNNAKV